MQTTDLPVIGITVSIDPGERIASGFESEVAQPVSLRQYLYIKRSYAKAVAAAGGVPILVSPETAPSAVRHICDGLVISGGGDIPPHLYGERPSAALELESSERIDWERRLLDLFAAASQPMLGVCYGMQLINVHFGGSLIQDLRTSGGLDHGGGGRKAVHEIRIPESSSLRPLLGDRAAVCSRHHQAVGRLAPGFQIAAAAPDGVVEAIESAGIMGVEWHPESDDTGPAVYRMLVERASAARSSKT